MDGEFARPRRRQKFGGTVAKRRRRKGTGKDQEPLPVWHRCVEFPSPDVVLFFARVIVFAGEGSRRDRRSYGGGGGQYSGRLLIGISHRSSMMQLPHFGLRATQV